MCACVYLSVFRLIVAISDSLTSDDLGALPLNLDDFARLPLQWLPLLLHLHCSDCWPPPQQQLRAGWPTSWPLPSDNEGAHDAERDDCGGDQRPRPHD